MGKLNEVVVEMTKLINRSPIDSFWIYSEIDLTFTIIGTNKTITIRTNDRVLADAEAVLITGSNSKDLPIGTYSIGTYSAPSTVCDYAPLAEDNRYVLIVETIGYITDVLSFGFPLDTYSQTRIPNIGEELIEWITPEENLRPMIKEITKGGYAVGATYSTLTRRGHF